jgi:dynein heavy chain, axonemal
MCPCLVQIPFFRKYRKWKSYTVLKKTVRAVKTTESKGALTMNLFLFVPALRTALGRIRALTVEVEKKRLLVIDPHRTYHLADFITFQRDVQEQLKSFLSGFSVQVQNEVKIACDEVVDQFLRINNIVADHKMTFMERASLRSECRKLTRFLRLVDFVVIDTMRNLALDSVRETVGHDEELNALPGSQA